MFEDAICSRVKSVRERWPISSVRCLNRIPSAIASDLERMIKAPQRWASDESGIGLHQWEGFQNCMDCADNVLTLVVFRGSPAVAPNSFEGSGFGDSLKIWSVTDRTARTSPVDFLNNQICLAHCERNPQNISIDIDKKQTWAKDVQTLLRGAIHLRIEKTMMLIPKTVG